MRKCLALILIVVGLSSCDINDSESTLQELEEQSFDTGHESEDTGKREKDDTDVN